MKVSLSWLSEYVPIEKDVSELADALTMAGLEVEGISDRYNYLDKVVVGRVAAVAPHPQADRLKCCTVDIGARSLAIVCGAPNVVPGMIVPTALPGMEFPDGTILESSVIRGIASEGMICSQAELGLGDDASGVMELNNNLKIGEKLAIALNLSDDVLQVSITPNRPDGLCVIGIAREIAAIQKTHVRYPDIQLPVTHGQISDFTSVTILSPDLCPRYAAGLVMDITVAPSPFWLRDRLLSAGLKPINNIVDITNYVMMELNQPLHAFDFDRLEERRIVVRTAVQGEPFSTLDGKERMLDADMLMICDGKKPVALAGVMGGLNSEITDSTRNVLIESAYFNPVSIRKTAKKMGMTTDASYRFERGVDPNNTVNALTRAAALMAQLGNGRLIGGVIDVNPKPYQEKQISLSVRAVNRVLGTPLNSDDMASALKSVEFQTQADSDDRLTVTVPSFRPDVSRPEDLMEEIARLTGYDHIPTTSPSMPAEAGHRLKQRDLREHIRELMIGFGFTEAVTYSFIRKTACDQLRLDPDDPRRNLIEILNPLTEDQNVMRTSLIPGLLETMYYNMARQIRTMSIFEIGKIFIAKGKDELPEEIEMLAGLRTGSRSEVLLHAKDAVCDFYDIKGAAEGLLAGLKIEPIRFERLPNPRCRYLKPGYAAEITSNGDAIGQIGEVHPEVLKQFDLKQPAFIFELNANRLAELLPEVKMSAPIPRYPAALRDLTLIVDRSIEAARLPETILTLKESIVETAFLFDVFEGGSIPKGKKSVSMRILYRSPEATLEDETVNQLHKTITSRLITEFGAALQ